MSTQLGELLIAYGVSAAAMLMGLLLMRADSRAYFRWPVYSAMAMALGVILWSMLRKHALPPEWVLTHSRTLYFCALGLYTVTGVSLGLLLGRLTGRKTPEVEERNPP
jgi:hypothetical protein